MNNQEVLDRYPSRLYLDGKWSHSEGGGEFDVFNPGTGEVIASVADATLDEARLAIDAASRASKAWASTAPRTRADILHSVRELMGEHRHELAGLISAEMGKPWSEALAEVDYSADYLRWFAEEAVRLAGRSGLNPEGTGHMDIRPYPVGPCYLITPWNFPLTMAARKVAPALAAGCTVVLKPSELTPLSSLRLAQFFEEAGLPDGVLNVVTSTRAAEISDVLISDARLRKISFTGSTAVGRTLLAQAGDNVLRTSMELGGNAPFIVFGDADLEDAVSGAMDAKFRNSGQACTAANRFLIQREILSDFTSLLTEKVQRLRVGASRDAGSEIGPLITDQAVAKIDELVRTAVGQGATVEVGGRPLQRPGSFYEPTVLSNVQPDHEIFNTEIFGPVVSITEFVDEAEAIELANQSEMGLSAYVYTSNMRRAERVAEQLEVGMLGLNTGVVSNAAAPFGGIKQSGLGREGGAEGIHEYLSTRYTLRPRD